MKNTDLFLYSGLHEEQILDPYYLDSSDPIIPKTAKHANFLVKLTVRVECGKWVNRVD